MIEVIVVAIRPNVSSSTPSPPPVNGPRTHPRLRPYRAARSYPYLESAAPANGVFWAEVETGEQH